MQAFMLQWKIRGLQCLVVVTAYVLNLGYSIIGTLNLHSSQNITARSAINMLQ